jgi:hypothetical protein
VVAAEGAGCAGGAGCGGAVALQALAARKALPTATAAEVTTAARLLPAAAAIPPRPRPQSPSPLPSSTAGTGSCGFLDFTCYVTSAITIWFVGPGQPRGQPAAVANRPERSVEPAAWRDPGGAHHLGLTSADSQPARELNPAVVQAMAEIGLDISAEFPRPLTAGKV